MATTLESTTLALPVVLLVIIFALSVPSVRRIPGVRLFGILLCVITMAIVAIGLVARHFFSPWPGRYFVVLCVCYLGFCIAILERLCGRKLIRLGDGRGGSGGANANGTGTRGSC